MAIRSGWEQRAQSYRSRLIGAARSGKLTGVPLVGDAATVEAEVRDYWEGGGDLRGGRAHRPRPTYAAPRRATEAESVGLGDAATYAELQRWRHRPPSRGGPPAWLPRSEATMGTDVAAILSQIDVDPKHWRAVDMAFIQGGGVLVTITPKRGYPRTVSLPDASAVEEFGRLLKSPVLLAANRQEAARLQKEWDRGRGDAIEVSTTGYRRTPGSTSHAHPKRGAA